MDIKILLQAFNQPWMIHPESAQHIAVLAARFLAGATDGFEQKEKEEYAFAVNAAGKRTGTIQDAVDNGVAVINLRGAVMKYDYCGAAGTQSLIAAINAANENPAIAAILLQIDSPGGAVDGTEQLANSVKNSAKPVVAYINGMMCSAAMWIGSAASMRIASSSTDIIGSIGTMASWSDYSGYLSNLGIKQHEVYATGSTHKNLPFREANGKNEEGTSNYAPLIKTWLDPLNESFHESIHENLPDAHQAVYNGETYLAKKAQAMGLINKIGTFQMAIGEALKLAAKPEIQTQHTMNKWTKFLALIGFTAAISSAQEIKLEDNQADNIESALAENEQLKAELKMTKDQLATAVLDRDRIQGLLETAQTTIYALEQQDAGIPSAVVAEKDNNPAANVNAAEMDFQKELFKKV